MKAVVLSSAQTTTSIARSPGDILETAVIDRMFSRRLTLLQEPIVQSRRYRLLRRNRLWCLSRDRANAFPARVARPS